MATTKIRVHDNDSKAEKATWTHTFTCQVPDGSGGLRALLAAEVTSAKMWLRDNSSTAGIINSHNGTNILSLLHATNGKITVTFHEADTPIVTPANTKEQHVASFELKYNGGIDALRYDLFHTVESMVGVS